MKIATLFSMVVAFLSLLGCDIAHNHIITVKNTLDVARSFETVEINKADLKLNQDEDFERFLVKDLKTNKIIISQFVDNNQDGKAEVLLFQPKIEANAIHQFELVLVDASRRIIHHFDTWTTNFIS